MKVKVLLISLLLTSILSKANWADTIQHTIGDCIADDCSETPEEFNFTFNNDTLIFFGKIYANSCGEHFLCYKIDSSVIELNRLDTGPLCLCHCLYDFEAKIPNCTLSQYRIKLDKYFDNGLDTIIFDLNTQGISTKNLNRLNGEINIYPNPARDRVRIYLKKDNNSIREIQIYNILGRNVYNQRLNYKKNIIELDLHNLKKGIYLLNLLFEDNSIFVKKIIKI